MSTVGQRERATQNRIVDLFRDRIGYEYLGNWIDRPDNRNIEEEWLRPFLLDVQGYAPALVSRAVDQLRRVGADQTKHLYERNRAVYELLRYGVKVRADVGDETQTVWLIDWKNPERNHFAIAEEVTIKPGDPHASTKRPDVVIYVNGIALGVIELKRSVVSVSEGIRQNLDNQKPAFIEHFFSTMQWLMAGNDTQGLRYGTIHTPEKHYLSWKIDPASVAPLDEALLALCEKQRFLELIHDFVVFDGGRKKLCRHNQYFGVRAAQEHVHRREGGIIWHTQGSGKSLTMVWLAKWIRENQPDARVLIITDRDELDEQIEKVFKGVDEQIYRTKSGADLIAKINATTPWLICSLIHKFGARDGKESDHDVPDYVAELRAALPKDFAPKGNLFVFVDECHRTQSGDLHDAMKLLLPNAMFIGFTGTPLMKRDRQTTIERFGPYIHTYRFDEAVRDGVVLDLRYEARDVDQLITSQKKIDEWFEVKTQGLTDLAKAQLRQKWGTMKKVLSSRSRLEQIVGDIVLDMNTRDRLSNDRGNAILVSGSIYQACKYYELFEQTELRGKCAIITSYVPNAAEIKGEETGEGLTEKLHQYEIYRRMIAEWFRVDENEAVARVDEFELMVKKAFIDEPARMKLLIVVDKLLTGFDAPPATYLYIDKPMQDHGLFQAICRVNRIDGDDKEYGYVVDYRDLFRSLEKAVTDYTSGAFENYDAADIAGLLKDRLVEARKHLEETLEAVRALCEPVAPPKEQAEYWNYFCASESGNAAQLKENEPKRLSLYKHVAALVRAYAAIAGEMIAAGYTAAEAAAIKAEVGHYEKVREEVKLNSGDAIDLKLYEPAMRHLIDKWVRAEESEKISALDDLSLIELIVERGAAAIDELPESVRKRNEAVAETIENNVRRLIIDEHPINPMYYERMSELLDSLIEQRRQGAMEYKEYLEKIVELTKQAKNPETAGGYPASMRTRGLRSLFDNLGRNEALALAIDYSVHRVRQDDWRANRGKVKLVRSAIRTVLEQDGFGQTGTSGEPPASYDTESLEQRVDRVFDLVMSQRDEY
jgi:type I restriction enzyme, R subunit